MIYFILIGIPVALLVLFLMLVSFEGRTGRRIFAGRRYALDGKVARAAFVVKHVDWGAFANDVVQAAFERTLHDVAHRTLIIVRAVERQLTVTVRSLRARREHPALGVPREARPSRFREAVSYVQKTIRHSRKQPRIPQFEEGAE